jgi:hypothetical protein
LAWLAWLHGLITGVDRRQRRLAVSAILGHLVVDGAAFCAVSGHLISTPTTFGETKQRSAYILPKTAAPPMITQKIK